MDLTRQQNQCKRRFARHPMQQLARFRFNNEATQDGVITNFSKDGLFLQLAANARAVHMKPRQRTRLMIALQFKNHVLKFLGQVTRHTSNGLGVKFVNCDPQKLDIAARLLSSDAAAQKRKARSQHPNKGASLASPKEHATPTLIHSETHHTNNRLQQKRPQNSPATQQLRRTLSDSFKHALGRAMSQCMKATQTRIAEEAEQKGKVFGDAAEWTHNNYLFRTKSDSIVENFLETNLRAFKHYLRGYAPASVLPTQTGTTMTTQTSKSPQAQQTKFSELSLMSESDVKKSVLLTSRAKSEEQLCEGALLELGIRAHEMLNVDKQKQIPVKPTLIAERFINELEALGVSDAARDIAMTQFNRVCISALPPCYKMLNQVLVKHGSAPDISKNPEWQARMRSSIHSKYESAARQTP